MTTLWGPPLWVCRTEEGNRPYTQQSGQMRHTRIMTDIERNLRKHARKLGKIEVSENKRWLTHKLQCMAYSIPICRSFQD